MSFVLKMIEAFPRGRTTEELLVLVGASFSHDKRIATVAELDRLLGDGCIERGRDGRWRPKRLASVPRGRAASDYSWVQGTTDGSDVIFAATASFAQQHASAGDLFEEAESEGSRIDPQALLRYWRSALRADPRGATTQVLDRHGLEWSLISGRGPIYPEEGNALSVTITLDALAPAFREALIRREGNENALALGWPMAVGRKSDVPVFLPVGMFTATWKRQGEDLVLTVDVDDVLVNPDWIRLAARRSGWTREVLAEMFQADDGLGLQVMDFIDKVRTAFASHVRGRLVGEDLVPRLDPSARGIHDSAAIFLPVDSSFTAGAVRDLDAISAWPRDRIARTALGAVLGLESDEQGDVTAAVDALPLNMEQLHAVRGACEAPLTVVTGPPGTGKSQAIVSMVASFLISGGSVLVASKNHQALDAVEDRLGGLAPDLPFTIRTLNPVNGTDVGFADVLKHLIDSDNVSEAVEVDELALDGLRGLAKERHRAVDAINQISNIECKLTDILERIEIRASHNGDLRQVRKENGVPQSWLVRLGQWFVNLFRSRKSGSLPEAVPESLVGMSLVELEHHLQNLRSMRDQIDDPADPIALGEEIQKITEALLPRVLASRTFLSEIQRRDIAEALDEWEFLAGKGSPPVDLSRSVITHRPLWLASILGAPRRIPLHEGLFDLVIFDEASQCDIATAIPLFARARRAVVVGDDRQLSFIPQLGQAQDRNLMQAQGLSVRSMGRFAQSRRSLFDFASRVPGTERVSLRHQYRSAGSIVDYISETYYSGQLETCYDPKRLIVPDGVNPGLVWEHVPAPGVPQTGNVNSNEVDAIVRHLKRLLLSDRYEGTVGVITPFRAQVMALENAIREAVPETQVIASDLKVGTVDGFQGQERDLILFSPCVGPRSPQSGQTFFQRDTRRLNVAISRARAVVMIFGDLAFARSGRIKALQRLAAKATEPLSRIGEGVFDSGWERKVYWALKERGLDPYPQFEIAGRRLDFALFGENGVKLDLEVDGRRWHQTIDGRRKTSDLWRDHQIKSIGFRVRRFWVDEFARDMEGCLDQIERDLS